MAKKRSKKKPVSVRKSRLVVGPSGVRVTPPSMRVGGRRAGFNITRNGASFSVNTRYGTFNTRRGCSRTLGLFLLPVLVTALSILVALRT